MAVPVLIAAVLLVLGWLGLLVLGLIRELDNLERRLTLVTMAMPGSVGRTGLSVGSPVPTFQARTLTGQQFASSSWQGREYLVLFAHPGCPPCEALAPPLFDHIEKGLLPPTVVVSQGSPDTHPGSWDRAARGTGNVVIVIQQRSSIARRFQTFITPHVFVVGAAGVVLAQAVAGTPAEIKSVMKKAHVRGVLPRTPATSGVGGSSI